MMLSKDTLYSKDLEDLENKKEKSEHVKLTANINYIKQTIFPEYLTDIHVVCMTFYILNFIFLPQFHYDRKF